MALDHLNRPDTQVHKAVQLERQGDLLLIWAQYRLPAAALYLRYDREEKHVVSMDVSRPDGIGLVHCVEPGLLAIGVSAFSDAGLDPKLPLATIAFAAGPSTVHRRPAAISQDARSAVRDLAAAESEGVTTLQWSERHTGDYDLNGEVNIADLTPIGMNFFATYSGTDDPNYAKLEVIDGDENGEVNIADLTPIGANFRSYITGYNVYRTALNTPDEQPDPAEGGRWIKVENASTPDGPSAPRDYNGQDFRLPYTFIDPDAELGSDYGYYVVATGQPDETPYEGLASNVATLSVGPPPALMELFIQAPHSELLSIDDEFYVGVKVSQVVGLFSANVRFEYDSSLVTFMEAVDSYTDTQSTLHSNMLEPPLFVSANNVGEAADDYILLGFNATQTKGTPVKEGDGYIGYAKFRAIAEGINPQCFRFPQSTTHIYLWGSTYGVQAAMVSLGAPLVVNIAQ